MYKYLKTETE